MTVCLVTGGAGFIGSHLVEALVADGHQVRVLDNFSTGDLTNLAAVQDRIELITGDLCDLDVIMDAMQEVEVVFHHAALPSVHRSVIEPLATHHACASGTLHVLLAAREAHVRRVIYGGSCSAYGDTPPAPRGEHESVHPTSPLAVAKLTGEMYCGAFTAVYGLDTVRLRYFNVFGPRQICGDTYSAVVPLFVEALVAGKRPVIFGDGKQSRDFTYVDDVVQANLLAADAPRVSGRVYNIACGRSITLIDLVERINLLLGTEIRPIHTPSRPGDVRHSHADISRAQADLGYCPCTDLDHGLRRCIDYYRAQRRGPKHLRKTVCPSAN
jgi:UDP-glucose 4-epimerase